MGRSERFEDYVACSWYLGLAHRSASRNGLGTDVVSTSNAGRPGEEIMLVLVRQLPS